MCLIASRVEGLGAYNWDGDTIIHETIVPSARPIVSVRPRQDYRIDVREFLITERNAIIREAIHERIPSYLRDHGLDTTPWLVRTPGSFDYRARAITGFVADTIGYRTTRGRDPWQFPDETLALGRGDCEDRAFLLASLLLGSGISPYNVRVAFGHVLTDGERHDHMWVAYKNEAGAWRMIEPLRVTNGVPGDSVVPSRPDTVVYEPHFLFNDAHLWAVRQTASRAGLDRLLTKAWVRLNPKFAGDVHHDIITMALDGLVGDTAWLRKALLRTFSHLLLVGPLVEAIDRDLGAYDPRDHADNAFIPETWQRINEHLTAFGTNNHAHAQRFGRAAHAIADFYAHSTYLHFATIPHPDDPHAHASPYDPSHPLLDRAPDYTTPDFTRLSTNTSLWTGTPENARAYWAGKIISGRYAQPHDTHGTIIDHLTEGLTNIPGDLLTRPDFPYHAAVPHHNELAVDEKNPSKKHRLYIATKANDRNNYNNQFRWRRNTAIHHIQQALTTHWTGTPLATLHV